MTEIPFWPSELIFAGIWILCRAAVWFRQRQIDWKREAALLLMYVNLAVLLRLAFFPLERLNGHIQPLTVYQPDVFPLRVNLIPLVHLTDYSSRRDMLLNTIGNAAMFVPSGLILPFLFQKLDSVWKVTAAGAGISICIELLQIPFSVRTTDIDDLLLNTAGALTGAVIYFTIKHFQKRKTEQH